MAWLLDAPWSFNFAELKLMRMKKNKSLLNSFTGKEKSSPISIKSDRRSLLRLTELQETRREFLKKLYL
jgi:hypothetical protein